MIGATMIGTVYQVLLSGIFSVSSFVSSLHGQGRYFPLRSCLCFWSSGIMSTFSHFKRILVRQPFPPGFFIDLPPKKLIWAYMRLIKFSMTWICMRVWIELTNEPQISIIKRKTEKKIENMSSNWLRHLKHYTDKINHHGYVISQLIWIQVPRLSNLSTINM